MGVRMSSKKKTKTVGRKFTMTEIEHAIARWLDPRQHIIVPNVSHGWDYKQEFDIFAIKKTGYAIEVEIKRTKADLKKDLLKEHKHETDKIKDLYFAVPEDKWKEWKEFIPERAGILTYYKVEDAGMYNYIQRSSKDVFIQCRRSPKPNKNAKKLTTEEQLRIARLGCMRIWNLKRTLISYENGSYT